MRQIIKAKMIRRRKRGELPGERKSHGRRTEREKERVEKRAGGTILNKKTTSKGLGNTDPRNSSH